MAVFLDITERKEREAALRESGQRLRAAIEASPVAILEMSLGDRVVSWNSAAERMFGWTEAEVVGKTLPIVPPGGEAGALSLNVRVEAGEVISGFEAKRRRKDGKDLDVEISAAPLYDSSGEVIGGMALYVDVSDRKQRELALRASEERLRAAIEASPVAIVELSIDNRVLMWNPAAERMFGWAPDEVVGGPLPIIPDELRREYESLVGRVRGGHVLAAHETIRHTKDGTPLDVEISSAPIRGSGGEIVSYMSVYVDVTERKRRELEVQRERDFLDILADAVPSFLVVVDTEGRLAGDAVNRAYTETFQWTADEVEGRSFFDLIAPEDGYNARMAVAAAANGVARTDLEGGWLCRDGTVRTVAWTATPLLEARDIPLVLITGADVTERVRQESEIRASRQRIVEAGDKARHRLERDLHDGAQQRLVALSITLRLAEAKLAEDAEGASQLLAASRDELSRAIDELRELARGIHPAVLTDRGLEAALEALTAKVPLPVELTLPGERLPAPVEAAAYYLIAEALTNVTKYAAATSARVAVTRLDGTLTVEVADDGIGGADPTAGSGLRGLADRVAALDGTLVVESPPGRGTCVRAEIPVREPALSK
jgi:PAS domain S-box-containing protein